MQTVGRLLRAGLVGSLTALTLALVAWRLLRGVGRRLARPAPRPMEQPAPARPLMLVAGVAAGLAGFVFFVVVAAPALFDSVHYPVVAEQPVAFNHQLHVETVGIECAFCHRTADQGVSAGLPEVQQCIFCHQVVGQAQDNPEIAKIRQAWSDSQVINWVRVHTVPDHSRFIHEPHVRAGISCSTCHGDVGRMQQVVQVRSLKMGDCVGCHQEMTAPEGCGACHY